MTTQNFPATPYGMTDEMFVAFLLACKEAGADAPRIAQTIGTAPASAGFHAQDGTIDGRPYCAAVDLSVKSFYGFKGYDDATIKRLLYCLAKHGFVAWYRYRDSFARNRHIHMVYVGHPMKPQLERQVHDFLNNRDGLAGHRAEPYFTAPPSVDADLLAKFGRRFSPRKATPDVAPEVEPVPRPTLWLSVEGRASTQVPTAWLQNNAWTCEGWALAPLAPGHKFASGRAGLREHLDATGLKITALETGGDNRRTQVKARAI